MGQLRARHTCILVSTGGLAFKLPRPLKLPCSRVLSRPKPMPYLAHVVEFLSLSVSEDECIAFYKMKNCSSRGLKA